MSHQDAHISTPPTYSEYSQNPYSSTEEQVSNSSARPYSPGDETTPSPHTSTSSTTINKPIVVPQKTNLFHIKTFSPFARSYPPSLSLLPNPILRSDFLAFVDGLNTAFLSHPIFQAAHVAGGALHGSQILPAQAVGGVFQVASVALSASASMVRVRSYMKNSNEAMFKPRGLVAKIMSMKVMIKAIGCANVDAKGRLALPPLEALSDLTPQTGALVRYDGRAGTFAVPVEDPRLRRMRALEGYIAPLEFESEIVKPSGVMDRYGGAPLRWLNGRQEKKLAKEASKSTAKRIEKAPEAESEVAKSEREIEVLDAKIEVVQRMGEKEVRESEEEEERRAVEARVDYELAMLEVQKLEEMERRDEVVRGVFRKGDKRLMKMAGKEEKIANRILWVVVLRGEQGEEDGELVEVG